MLLEVDVFGKLAQVTFHKVFFLVVFRQNLHELIKIALIYFLQYLLFVPVFSPLSEVLYFVVVCLVYDWNE